MINSIGPATSSALEALKLRDSGKAKAAGSVSGQSGATVTSLNPASRMAAEGAPVDLDRIAAIKSAIASGDYPVDPDLIAVKMLSLDLPSAD